MRSLPGSCQDTTEKDLRGLHVQVCGKPRVLAFGEWIKKKRKDLTQLKTELFLLCSTGKRESSKNLLNHLL